MPRTTFVALGLALVCSTSASAQAEPELTGNLPGKFSISAGVLFATDLDTKIRLDRDNRGTTIDLEELLGLNSSAQSFAGGISWRPHRRHLLTARGAGTPS